MASIEKLHPTDVLRLFPRLLQVYPDVAFTIPCIPPVGAWEHNHLSSKFGWRLHPIQGRFKHHEGIDIAGPHQLVRSTASGVVYKAGYERGLGLYVIIDHGNSYQTIYGHLALLHCKAKQKVRIGEPLGVLGQTGQATGLHLHYAVRKAGRYLDPGAYLTVGLSLINQYVSTIP
ncbi:M23 family metallopeptidase [uncultured Fibrella sp.]|uniref:M23 family metallopeptidase n=1 Tax=uncultured Fibrella sp. TaxID=1284596 RepID=UPI0035CC536C